jgi:hypothetical protein
MVCYGTQGGTTRRAWHNENESIRHMARIARGLMRVAGSVFRAGAVAYRPAVLTRVYPGSLAMRSVLA